MAQPLLVVCTFSPVSAGTSREGLITLSALGTVAAKTLPGLRWGTRTGVHVMLPFNDNKTMPMFVAIQAALVLSPTHPVCSMEGMQPGALAAGPGQGLVGVPALQWVGGWFSWFCLWLNYVIPPIQWTIWSHKESTLFLAAVRIIVFDSITVVCSGRGYRSLRYSGSVFQVWLCDSLSTLWYLLIQGSVTVT